MCNPRTNIMQALPFGIGQMNAMAKYRAFIHQAIMVIHVQIAVMVREKLTHPCDFIGVLRDVGLHVNIGKFAPQRTSRLKLRGAGSGCEAWRNGVAKTSIPLPSFNQRF